MKRQKKRLVALYQAGVAQVVASGQKPPRSIIGGAGEGDETANDARRSAAAHKADHDKRYTDDPDEADRLSGRKG